MTLLYFFSMAYMIIHLSFVVYKKGEQLRIKVSNYSHPASDESYLQKWSMRIKRLAIEIKALFNKKYKLMKKEINKSYD